MSYYEDLTISRGADVAIRLDFSDDENNKKDLTGYTINAYVKNSITQADSEAIKMGIVTVEPKTEGTIFLVLDNSVTSLFDKRRYLYSVDLEYDDSTGLPNIVEKAVSGRLIISE